MVGGDFLLRQILIFVTVDGVLSQWPTPLGDMWMEPSGIMGGSLDMMGGGGGLEPGPLLGLEPGPMGGLEPGMMGGMGDIPLGGGMNGPGIPPGRGMPIMSLDQLAEYQELPFQARPLAAQMAQRQWNEVLNPQTVMEKPKKYKFPDGRPAQNGQDKNAWKKLKSSLDRTLTAFPNGLQRRPNQNQGRFQNRVQNNNVRQSGGANNQLRQQPRPPQNQQFQRQQMTRQNNNNIQGRGFRNLRPVGPQPARNMFQGRSPMPLKNNFPQRTLFTQPKPQSVTPLPRNLAKGRPMLPSMLPQGSAVPIRQPLTMTSQNNAMQSGFVSQQTRQMNTYPAINNQGSIMSAQTSIQGVSQANAKPLAIVNRFPQAATQPGIYDTRGVKAPPGYTPIVPNTPTAPRKKPMIESMRKAVQNGEQIMGNSSKTSNIASSNKNTSTLEALTQAAEGPSLKNVKVQPSQKLRSGIPSTLAPIVTTPPPVTIYGVTQGPYMDTYGTNSWGMAPTTSAYDPYYLSTGTQGLYDPYNFATDIPHTLHYSHQSNLDIRQPGARNPIPTGEEHQRLLQQQELRQKQLQYERQQQQMMIHRQQYEKQYIAKQQQYMQAISSTAPPTERPTAPPTSSASLRRSEKVPVAVQMVTSTLTVPTQPPPTSTTTPIPTTTKTIKTTTVTLPTTTQVLTTTRDASTQQGADSSTRIPPPGIEDRIGVRPNNVDPNPDPNGPRPLPTQPIAQQSPTVPTMQENTGASQGTTTLKTEAPLETATTITPEPSIKTTKSTATTNTNAITSSTIPSIVSSTTPSPTSTTVTELITKPPVLTTTNQGLTNAPEPQTEGQNNVVDKNKLSVPTLKPPPVQQPSKPKGIQQNGIPIEQDPRYLETLPAYHLANAQRNQVNNQIGNSLTVAQNNQIFNRPSGSGVNVKKQQGNFGMLTVQQQQSSRALSMVGRMQPNNLQQSPVPYNTLPFSQRNSLLGQGTLSQSNVMRQNVRSAVQPRFTGPMTMQQRGTVPQSGFRGMNPNVPYQNPAMRQGLQVDSTIYQNPSQLGNRSRFSQMSLNPAQTNVAGGTQASQMSFQRYPGQSMNQNRRWPGNLQAGPRGLSAQGHSKHSARLSNRPNPDMSLLTVMQKRGALFRSTSASTANAKAGHLAMTLSKKVSKNQVAGPKVESLKQNSESSNSTKAEKNPKTTTTITPQPTTTGSTTVQSTGDTSTTTHSPRMLQGNLVISQKVTKQQSNTSVESKSQPESRRIKDPRNEGNLNIIQRPMKGGMYPTTPPSPRDIIRESNKELSKRLNGQLYVAQRRRILPSKLRPRLRTLDVTFPNKNGMNAPNRTGTNLLRTQNQRLTSNTQPHTLQQRQLSAQRSRQNLAANRRQISPASSFVQSRTSSMMNKLHSQISHRVQGPLLASGTAKRQPHVRPSPMPNQRRNQNQLQRHSPRVHGQASTSVNGQGLVQTRVQGQRLTPQVQNQRLTQTRNQGQRQILTRNQGQRQAPVQGPPRTQTTRGQRQGNNLPRVQGQRHNFARTQVMRQTLPRAQVPRRVPNRVQSASVQRSPLKSMQVSRRQFQTPGVGLGMQRVGPVYRPVFAQTRMQTTSGNVIPRGPIHRLRPQAPTNIRPGVFRARG